MRHFARIAALLLGILAVGCSGPGASPPDATTVLRESGQAMSSLKTVSADVQFGPGITVQGLTLTSATTMVAVPDQSDTTIKVKQGDFLVDVRVVTTGGHVYLRLPFSQFTEVSASSTTEVPDLSRLFDPKTGLATMLPAGKDTKSLGTEQIAGVDCDKVQTTYTADQVGLLFDNAVRPAGDVQATIWSGQSDHYVRRVVLNGPLLEAGKNVSVQVDLHDFNKPVSIATPTTTTA
jgi:hypothetical protein